MIKKLEATEPNSYWNKAKENEMVFILFGHDTAAPSAIRAWIRERIRSGKNYHNDAQIIEARQCAAYMHNGAKLQPVQDDFDITIGKLDHALSLLVGWGREKWMLSEPNKQTLKHHAEDMIAAGEKILKDLKGVEGLPQP